MIRVSQLGLAVGMALSAAAAHADPASAALYQRLFKPNVPEQFRTDALAFALASAWQARGCQVEPALAEVMAAGLARETDVARFEQKLGLVADAGCGGGCANPAGRSTIRARRRSRCRIDRKRGRGSIQQHARGGWGTGICRVLSDRLPAKASVSG